MDFQDYITSSGIEVNQQLFPFLESWQKKVAKVSPKLSPLYQIFVDGCQGGKRIRGILVKLGFEMAKGKFDPEILKAAASYEIFQTAILDHDDIIDQSFLRRGKPTIYRQLGGDHYGISQAICLGDVGFFLAMNLLASSKFSQDRVNKAMIHFNQTMIDTALGEILDVEMPHLKEGKNEEDILTIFRLKTAHYTIIGPLQLGAVLGGASNLLLTDIGKISETLGIAFQIQDDILGVFGDEKTLGKSVTSDIEEGKNTLLIVKALENANPEQKKILERYYGKGKIGEPELEQIKKVFVDTGALEYSQTRAKKMIEEAKRVIAKMEIESKYQDLLTQMADFLVERSK